MPPYSPTPARSSLKGRRPRRGDTKKKSVTFVPDSTISRAPIAIGSALDRTFGPTNVQGAPPETGEEDDDDKPYTTTDEERDEFQYEPYEFESSPEPEAERVYEYLYGEGRRETEQGEDEGGYKYEGETVVPRTLAPTRSRNRPTASQRFADPEDPVAILRHNIHGNMMASQQRKAPNYPTARKSRTQNPGGMASKLKGKMNIDNRGSPLLDNTPDIRLRSQMRTKATPRSGLGIAQWSLDSLKKARRNLTTDYTAQTPVEPRAQRPHPPHRQHLTRLEKNTLTTITTLLLLWALFTLINKSGVLAPVTSKVTDTPKSLSPNAGQIISGIAAVIISVPQFLICSVIICESTTNKRLRNIAIIASNANLDVTALKHFTELVTELGKPLALNSAARDLAGEANDEAAKWRDGNTIKILADLSVSYQEAHEEIRQMVGQSQNVIQWSTKTFTEFSGFLTEQIPREVRDKINLPNEWTIGVLATQKEYSSRALIKYHKGLREGTSKVYCQLLLSAERAERSIKAVVQKTREINDAGILKMAKTLDAVEPVLKSITKLRENIAFATSHYATDNTFGEESVGRSFTPSVLTWRFESLWTSLSALPGSMVEVNTKSQIRSGGPRQERNF